MKTETKIRRDFTAMREKALKLLVKDAKKALPKGWTINLAVGWGFLVYDNNRNVVSADTPYETGTVSRLPAGVRPLINAAATFYDLYEPGNEVITSKGLKL
jgi:hypothetical protein